MTVTKDKIICLIDESDCGRQAVNPVCPKCGMDERVVYPSQSDLNNALQFAELAYWKSHAQRLEKELTSNHLRIESENTGAAVQRDDSAHALRVKKIIAEQLGVDAIKITREKSFVKDLGAESLDVVELIMALEDDFGIEISDEEAEQISTVQQAVDYLAQRTKK